MTDGTVVGTFCMVRTCVPVRKVRVLQWPYKNLTAVLIALFIKRSRELGSERVVI